MDIKILEQKENPLLKRKEISAEVFSTDKTPSNKELKKELSILLKTKEELLVIKQINQIFGKKTSKVEACIYKDEKSLKEIEPKLKVKKAKPKEGEAKPEAKVPAEQKKEEKPAEVPKEQPKPKEKKKE